MSLPHAILTALLEKPSSGLELTRRFDRSIGYFWSATHQQIYRELGKLEQAGHIRALPSDQPARGQKKDYEVLPAGLQELTSWVTRPEDPRQIRDPLLLRLRAAAVVGGPDMEAELVRHLELHRAQLEDYLAFEQRDFPPGRRITRQDRLRHVVLRGGIELETFWTKWLTDTLAELRDPEDGPTRHAAPDGP
ncbi:PadR family transcriptional regulator [Streptomyces pristinaespiralis]|uniref:Transcriptional regulator n=2 Tax=Streptomyces pristinaespiralis TaxID=38300 RepID=D6X9H9_STRE2|nr:PadR family transcriptional regulator [Streptomyces pristinaespiralis]ALC21970.1 transcriptional regulator [Streptomyces pristinaespiralis]EFH31301.1 transcriptional regulator [Streptomyces pristinaespiralis ATCC 25486]QMU15371.1 PadR family transcriptional regulator [Streptomyces pristinaespiralis]